MGVLAGSCSVIGPGERSLSFEEEKRLQEGYYNSMLLPPEQRAIEQRIINCEEEQLKRRDWSLIEEWWDEEAGGETKCEDLYGNGGENMIRKRDVELMINIDRQLEEALKRNQ